MDELPQESESPIGGNSRIMVPARGLGGQPVWRENIALSCRWHAKPANTPETPARAAGKKADGASPGLPVILKGIHQYESIPEAGEVAGMASSFCFHDLAKPRLLHDFKNTIFTLFHLPLNFRNPVRPEETLFEREPDRWSPVYRFLWDTRQGRRDSETLATKLVGEALRCGSPAKLKCFAGLTHISIPIVIDGKVEMVLLTGDFLTGPPDSQYIDSLVTLARRYGGNPDPILQGIQTVPILPVETVDSLINLLVIFCDYIALLGEDLLLKRRIGESDPVGQIREFIQNHYREKLTLNRIASEVHLSSTYVSRLFRRQSTQTLTAYQNEVRIAEARRLLATTRMRIGEICYEVGYQNLSHFTRNFKNLVGVSPSVYRNEHLNSQRRMAHLDDELTRNRC